MRNISIVISLMLFSSLQAQDANLTWAKSIGGTSDDVGQSVAVDASGNVYTTGSFYGAVDFDPGTGIFNVTTAVWSIFISKLDASGNFVWAKSIPAGVIDYSTVVVDVSGNIYIIGQFSGTVDFDLGPAIFNVTAGGPVPDLFILKLDASGNFVWAKNMTIHGYSIAVDVSGNVCITGYFQGTVDFDPEQQHLI